MEDPVRPVRTALKTWRFAPGVVDESRWAVFFTSRALLGRRLSAPQMGCSDGGLGGDSERGSSWSGDPASYPRVGSFVPCPERARLCLGVLVNPAYAPYVEKINDFLLRGVDRHPLMTDARIRSIVVRETDPRQWKTSSALLACTDLMVSFQDCT